MARRASHGRGGFWRTDWAVGAVLRSACARARLREDRSLERNVGECAVCLCEDLIRAASAAEAPEDTQQDPLGPSAGRSMQMLGYRIGLGQVQCLDRKSTRLNSSHVKISY